MDDLLEDCISSFDGKKDYAAFKETFCIRCHRPECRHAGKANDGFTQRVKTQVDRLFNSPVTDNQQPRYAMITDFVDVSSVAEQIEVHSRPPVVPNPVKTKKDEGGWEEDYLDRHLGTQDKIEEENAPKEQPKEEIPLGPKRHAPSMIIKPGNTDFPAGGIILPGGPNSTSLKPAPKVDPWAVPVSPTNPIKVVERGAKIKMGD